MLVIGKASQRQCPLPSTLQGIFSVPCTLPFCLCPLKKVKPRYTNTHTNHPEKKKKKKKQQKQADEHARTGSALSWRKSGTGRDAKVGSDPD